MLVIEQPKLKKSEDYLKTLSILMDDDWVFTKESTDAFLENVSKTKSTIKDIAPGIPLKVESVSEDYTDITQQFVEVNFTNGITGFINAKRELKFLERIFEKKLETIDDLNDLFADHDIYAIHDEESGEDEGIYSIRDGWYDAKRKEFNTQLYKSVEPKVYTAHIYDRNTGGYFCTIDGVQVYMPGSLAAANKITNFDELLGKNIKVMIENYLPQTKMYIVSNKKYIQYILPIEAEAINVGDEFEGKITGVTDSAIFVEFNSIFTGMLHISELDKEHAEMYSKGQFKDNDKIKFRVKSVNTIRGTIKFVLTQKTQDDADTVINNQKEVYEQFRKKYEQSICKGTVIFMKNDYAFINFEKHTGFNVRGLLSAKQISNYASNGIDIKKGVDIDVYINNVIPEESKIFLRYAYHTNSTNKNKEKTQ